MLSALINRNSYMFFFLSCAIGALSAAEAPVLRTNYQIYNPTITLHTVDSNYGHDATIVYFDKKWIAQWDDGTEKPGQKIRQSTSLDLKTWSTPIEVYSSAVGSKNPIVEDIQWQPSLVVRGKELWSFHRGANDLYFSRLSEGSDKWENVTLFGRKDSVHSMPLLEGKSWGVFAGNAGIVSSSGRVMVPVTLGLLQRGLDFYTQPKRDSIIYSDDDGKTWSVSDGAVFGDGTQSWEASIWQPSANIVNMISRNNRKGPYNVRENLKVTRSTDNGVTWAEQRNVPALDAAMSRPHAIRLGARNILAQNDWYISSNNPVDARRNLTLYFSRGDRPDDFVSGLPITLGETKSDVIVDYPQIAINGNTAVVIYSSGRKERITRVAEITPLPQDNRYYIFPRNGHSPVEVVTSGRTSILQFKDNYNSAGIDIDPSTSNSLLGISFKLKPESSGRQSILDLSNGVTLIAEKGRLILKKMVADGKEVDCGSVPMNTWTQITFKTGRGITAARVNSGSFCTVDYSPYPWQPYLGHNSYSDKYAKIPGQKFSIDLASIMTKVE